VKGALLRRGVATLPTPMVRAVGRAQFRYPALRRLLLRVNAQLTESEGVIGRGVGAGLLFNATGGYPGYLLGTSEPEEQEMIKRLLAPGAVFYDIGANVGFFSTLAARLVGPQGHVYAFEPFPESAARARANAALNNFDHVTVVEAAVSRGNGRLTLALSDSSATHHLATGVEGLLVDVVGIDMWRADANAPAPTLVMIDTEGAELDVLEGMSNLLREHRPWVLCEVHWLGDAFTDYFAEQLEPLGYRLSNLHGGPVPSGAVRWHAVLDPQ
jgi:FkbM family methyltransferase